MTLSVIHDYTLSVKEEQANDIAVQHCRRGIEFLPPVYTEFRKAKHHIHLNSPSLVYHTETSSHIFRLPPTSTTPRPSTISVRSVPKSKTAHPSSSLSPPTSAYQQYADPASLNLRKQNLPARSQLHCPKEGMASTAPTTGQIDRCEFILTELTRTQGYVSRLLTSPCQAFLSHLETGTIRSRYPYRASSTLPRQRQYARTHHGFHPCRYITGSTRPRTLPIPCARKYHFLPPSSNPPPGPVKAGWALCPGHGGPCL